MFWFIFSFVLVVHVIIFTSHGFSLQTSTSARTGMGDVSSIATILLAHIRVGVRRGFGPAV